MRITASNSEVAGHGRASGRGGFTLIEIIVVVIIMAIIAATAVGVSSNSAWTRVTEAGRRLLSDLSFAQNVAVTQQRTVYAIFDTTNQRYTVAYTQTPSAAADYVRDPSTGGNFVAQFGNSGTTGLAGVSLRPLGLGSGNKVLAFDVLGQPLVGNGTASPVLSTQSVTITVGNSLVSSSTMTVSVAPFTGATTCTSP